MRIFYAVANSPNSALRSNLWRQNLRGSLGQLGHEIIDFNYDLDQTFEHLDPSNPAQESFIARNRPQLGEALLDQLRRAHAKEPINLFFSYFYNACVEPDVICEIRALGIITVNWFCNASYQFHLVNEIAPKYHFCLVPEKFRLEAYRGIGANPIYCQEAANPDVYRPYPESERFDAGFIGQAYGERPGLIESLIGQGINVNVWGPGWEQFAKRRPSPNPLRRKSNRDGKGIPKRYIGGVLSDEEMVRTFSRTKINLGFAACWTAGPERITQIRLRDFEIPMSGAFYLTEFQDELADYFDIGREIVCYRDADELRDKISFYLRHPTERERIRTDGRRRCLNDHTWAKRFEKVFRLIGLAG